MSAMNLHGLGLVAAVALVVVVALPGCGDYRKDICEPLRADAVDPKKMKYVRDWVAGHERHPVIRERLRDFPSVLLDDRTIHELGGFDWKLFGIVEGNGWLEVFRADVNDDRIDAVEVGLLRSHILVSTGDADRMRRALGPVRLAGLERFPDDVFVFCGSAHGEVPD